MRRFGRTARSMGGQRAAGRDASIGSLPAIVPTIAMAIALTIGACSSGDPSGGGSGGGIGGTGLIADASGVSRGAIAGFGSIVLNGESFDTDRARIRIESRDAAQSELRVGMQVRAEVNFDDLTADVVEYYPSISAPIESVDATGASLRLLGQSVSLDGAVVYDGIDPATLAPGTVLEVSGLRNAAGAVVATFVRAAPAPARLAITGSVESHDDGGARLVVAGVGIDAGGSAVIGNLEPGSLVFVSGRAGTGAGSDARLLADSVVVLPGLAGPSGTPVELEGIVTGYASARLIELSGQRVRISDATRLAFTDGRAAPASRIALNTRIEVEGELQADGAVSATRIVVLPVDDSRLIGPIESLDPTSGVLVVLGVPIHTTPGTRYRSDETSSFAALRVGDYVEVRAAFEAARLIASRVEVDDPEEEARLEGPLTDIDPGARRLAVLGIAIAPGEDTEFEIGDDEVRSSEFLSAARLGDIVRVRWRPFSSTTAAPDEIGLE